MFFYVKVNHGSEVCSDNSFPYNPLLIEGVQRRSFKEILNDEISKKFVWGNGKDWRIPSAKEGGWIRIYPITIIESTNCKVFRNSYLQSRHVVDKTNVKDDVNCLQK